MKTALAMAREQCCNYRRNGTCIRLDIVPENWEVEGTRSCPCLLACKRKKLDLGPEPVEFSSFAELDRFLDQAEAKAVKFGDFHLCGYFEKAVLPLARYWPKYVSAVEQYNWQRNRDGKEPIAIFKQPKVRFCKCGAELPPRQRVCDKCKRKRRREAYRKANEKRRKSAGNSDNISGSPEATK